MDDKRSILILGDPRLHRMLLARLAEKFEHVTIETEGNEPTTVSVVVAGTDVFQEVLLEDSVRTSVFDSVPTVPAFPDTTEPVKPKKRSYAQQQREMPKFWRKR